MPEIQYPTNPNSDTAFVVQEDGTKNRALMTAPQDTSTLELPSNANSTKGYVTIDGKKQRVILTANIGGGGGGGDFDKSKVINKTSVMPAADASNLGQVYMYTGARGAFQSPVPFADDSGATITIDSSVLLAHIQSTYPDKTIDKVAVRYYGADNFLIRYNFTDGNRRDEGYQTEAMLNQKGITVSGTPTASAWADSEFVPSEYTHGYVYENQLVDGNYGWVRIDVQPLPEVIKVNTTVTLAAADWSSNTQTVSVTGMTPDGVVLVSPDPTDQSAYTSAGILCTMQGVGMLTFTCDTVPSADIVVTVVML